MRSARSSVSVFVSAALLLACACGAAFGQGTAKPSTVAMSDGVIVDPGRQVAYVQSRRGIEAIDLVSGTPLWTAEVAAKPLLAVGDLLLAQAEARAAGRLDVVSFDSRNGSPGHLKARIDLPGDVTARLRDTLNSSFRVAAHLQGDHVLLAWDATKSSESETGQGYLPADTENAAPAFDKSLVATPARNLPRQLAGAVELDLGSGRVKPASKAAAGPRPLDLLEDDGLSGLKGRQFSSADGRHVLVSQRNAGADVWQSYRWTIYARANGERLGELAHYTSSAPFLVADGRLVYVSQPFFQRRGDDVADVPLTIRAVDLASGMELWTKEAPNPAFEGPFPP